MNKLLWDWQHFKTFNTGFEIVYFNFQRQMHHCISMDATAILENEQSALSTHVIGLVFNFNRLIISEIA